jgi:hypothetical protein
MFLDDKSRVPALRADIRDDLRKQDEPNGGGMDFYGPFWADAKAHAFGEKDLTASTNIRIQSNWRRKNLYPLLATGFLTWWEERRRWTNAPLKPGPKIGSKLQIPSLDAVVKIDNFLVVVDDDAREFIVYHYCFPDPALTSEAARLGLWAMSEVFPDKPLENFRILDVIRSQTFSMENISLGGDEEIEFQARYAKLVAQRDELRKEYE